jgi:hypothetical protein
MELLTESYDWTRPTTKHHPSKNYNYDEFVQQIKIQIEKKFKNSCTKIWGEKYFLQEIKITLDEHQYNKISEYLKIHEQVLYPIVTFHSTQNVTKVNSIIKYGYIIPGTKHPTLGWTNNIYIGNIYGDGIYSSPEFELSQSYTFLDLHNSIQIIINLVILGKTKVVEPNKWFPDKWTILSNNEKNIKLSKKDIEFVIPSRSENGYKDLDDNEYDTLISLKQDVIVSGSSENIIPTGYITLSPDIKKMQDNKNYSKRYLLINSSQKKTLFDDNLCYDLDNDIHRVDFINIFNDYYIIDTKNIKQNYNTINTPVEQINNFFVIPITMFINDKIIYQFEDFFDSFSSSQNKSNGTNNMIKQNKLVYLNSLYDKYSKISLGSREKFSSFVKNYSTYNINTSSNSEEYLGKILVEILEQIIKLPDNHINVIYLYVSEPTDCEPINKIVHEYKVYKKIIVKIIFFENANNKINLDSKNKIFNCLIEFKNEFQTINFFEKYHHQVNLSVNESLVDTFDILLDEYLNIPEINYTKLSIPYGFGVIGEGFIDSIEAQPKWDIVTPNPYVLFKGDAKLVKINSSNYKPKYIKKDDDFFKSLQVQRDHIIKSNEILEKKIIEKRTIDSRLYTETLNYKNNFVGLKKDLVDLDDKDNDHFKDKDDENLYCQEKLVKPELEFDTIKKERAFADKLSRYQELKIKLADGFVELENLEPYCKDYEDIEKLYSVIVPILSKFRAWVFKYPKRVQLHIYDISKLIEELTVKLDTFIGKETVEFIRDIGYDQTSLSTRKTIKYQLNSLLADITTFSKIKWNSKYLTKLLDIRYSNKIIKRLKNQLDINSIVKLIEPNKIYGKKITDPIDLFAYFDIEGLVIRIRNSASSEIDPWNIIVEYVGTEKKQMYQMILSTETDTKIFDSKGKKINGLVLDYSISSYKPVSKIYYSHLYTLNPYLIIPNQEISLVVNSWVSSVEKIFKLVIKKNMLNKMKGSEIKYNIDNLKKSIIVSIELYQRVISLSKKNKEILEIFNQLVNKSCSYEFVTSTKNNITSINKILSSLSLTSELDFEQEHNIFQELGFVLIAESTIRNARAKTKILKKTKEELGLEFLGLNENTNLDIWEFNKSSLDRCINLSNKFFFKSYTNCSPFSIVACLGFIEISNRFARLAKTNIPELTIENISPNDKTALTEIILNEFTQGNVSMGNFLTKYLRTTKTKQTQVGLYLYGLRWSSLDKPENVSFDDPVKIKSELIEWYKELVRLKQEIIIKTKLNTKTKLLQKQIKYAEKAYPFKKYHQTSPTIFGPGTIDELNIFRDKDDQLELTPNGLLKYHCAHPDCPYYLKKFMCEKDIMTANTLKPTRHGLMNHLKYDKFNCQYVKNFHNIAKCMAKNSTWEEFVNKMDNYYKNNLDYVGLEFRQIHLENAYKNYSKK